MPTITLSIHGGKHCSEWCPWSLEDCCIDRFGPEDDHMFMCADYIVIALDEYGHAAGAWKYEKDRNLLSSCGTWVSPKFRKHGLAKKMWEFGILYENPKRIFVAVISDRGYSLVDSMKKRFPNIEWEVEEQSDRKLRKLKK